MLVCWCRDVLVSGCVVMCLCVHVLVPQWSGSGVLVWQSSCGGVLMCWLLGVLMCWCVDVLMSWCGGVIACWSVDVLVCWYVDVPMCYRR